MSTRGIDLVQKVQIGKATLYCGKCEEVLPSISTVDAVVTDPPWKAGNGGRFHRREGEKLHGVAPSRESKSLADGDIGFFSAGVIEMFKNVSRADILVLCGFMELPEVIEAIGHYRGVLVWHNTRPAPIPGPIAARDVAFIVWGGAKSLINPKVARWKSCLFTYPSPQAGCMATERILNRDGSTAHPAQEPLALFMDIVRPLGKVILDPYMGSGTTGVAAIRTGRSFIGIEKEPKYFDVACKRLQDECSRSALFEEQPHRAEAAETSLLDAVS